jgi:hypothetical protein
METGVCVCGEHNDRHVEVLDDLKRSSSIACKLTKDLVPRWNTVAPPPQRPPQ